MDWQRSVAGPADARHTVLLLPGGLTAARSYAEVMMEPALAGVRLVAATLPGHAGTPAPADTSIENYARLIRDLAREIGCDVIVGSSMGATVALELVTSKQFAGPTVLLGISLSSRDDPAFFRAIVAMGSVLGPLPAAVLTRLSATMLRSTALPPARRAEYASDLRRNQAHVTRRILREYARYLAAERDPAARLCGAGVPTWIVHAERGDGGLTDRERRTLAACPSVALVTLPGTSYLLHSERPREIAQVIRAAVDAA